MNYEIGFQGAFPLVRVMPENGTAVKFEQGAMVYNNGKVQVKAKPNGGLLKGMMKKAFTNEDLLIGLAVATSEGAMLSLAPKGMGDIYAIEVSDGNHWYLSDGAFLASQGSVDFNVTMQKNLGGVFFGKTGGLLIMKTTGNGTMLLNALGAIEEIELNGEEFNIDNGHVLAWTEGLQYNIAMSGGLGGSLLSGEGLVMKFHGTGKVLVQTRKAEGLASLVIPFMAANEALPEKGPLGGGGNGPLGGGNGPLGGGNNKQGNGPLGGGGNRGGGGGGILGGGGRNRGGFGRN